MKRRLMFFTALVAALFAVFMVAGAAAATPVPFSNGFETNINGWDHWSSFGTQFVPTRVASGTDGVTSATGSWHAEAFGSCGLDKCGGSASTDWGGYSSTFPTNGYSTSVDVYLNVGGGYANDTRFDWDSAISNASGGFGRDFVFNCGYYDVTDTTGSVPRFVCSASNNAGRGSSFPENPGRSPYAISTTGWYTFVHHFYNSGTGGVLAADLSILDTSGNVLHTWTLSDPTDVIGSTVGGNRYGWFASQELPFLAFDNSRLSFPSTCMHTGFMRDGIDLTAALINPGTVIGPVDASGCNIGVYYGPDQTGSVSGATISGSNYYGVVANAAAVDVTNTTINQIGETPLNGTQHGIGVLYTTIDQTGAPTRASATGTLSGSTITNYQKNGVVVSGPGAVVKVLSNTVTGQGPVNYIAQNGIQISYGASGTVTGNTVSNNWYTGPTYTACGLLFYQAAGVKQSANVFSGNQTNLCNAGRGGGNTRP